MVPLVAAPAIRERHFALGQDPADRARQVRALELGGQQLLPRLLERLVGELVAGPEHVHGRRGALMLGVRLRAATDIAAARSSLLERVVLDDLDP
jgi:hypothetical protein